MGFEQLEQRELLTVQLQFDYSLDTLGFMTPSRRTLLQDTLNAIAARFNNSLAAVPSTTFQNFPSPSGPMNLTTSVPANTLKIYVFGLPMSGSQVGLGGPFYDSGNRGEPSNRFAPDVQYIEFDDNANWYFGSSTTSGVDSQGNSTSLADTDDSDFVTVATHEFLHGLGFLKGISDFNRYVSNGFFMGPNAEQAHGNAAVPLSSDGSHVASTVLSVMNPALTAGTRVPMSSLEWGFLEDIGWSVAPGASGLYRQWDLFTGGESGSDVVEVFPSRGVYLMEVDVLAGDTLTLKTTDGGTNNLLGVSTELKLFDANGDVIASRGPSGGTNKASLTWTFPNGGEFYVGAGAVSQSSFTFTGSSTGFGSSQGFILKADLDGQEDSLPQNIVSATTPFSIGPAGYTSTSILTDVSSNVYAMNTVAGHTYAVTTALPSGGGLPGPAIISIYDGSGNKIAGMTAPAPDSDVGGDYGETTFTAAGAGPYYVMIQPYVGTAQVAPNQGSLSVGWGTITSSGEFSANGDRNAGNDYAITVKDATQTAFEAEKRVIIRTGPRKSKKTTTYQLTFSEPLDSGTAQNAQIYHVFQVVKLKRHRTKQVAVRVTSATLGPGGTTVTLRLGQFKKNLPLNLQLSGLVGSNGVAAPAVATTL